MRRPQAEENIRATRTPWDAGFRPEDSKPPSAAIEYEDYRQKSSRHLRPPFGYDTCSGLPSKIKLTVRGTTRWTRPLPSRLHRLHRKGTPESCSRRIRDTWMDGIKSRSKARVFVSPFIQQHGKNNPKTPATPPVRGPYNRVCTDTQNSNTCVMILVR